MRRGPGHTACTPIRDVSRLGCVIWEPESREGPLGRGRCHTALTSTTPGQHSLFLLPAREFPGHQKQFQKEPRECWRWGNTGTGSAECMLGSHSEPPQKSPSVPGSLSSLHRERGFVEDNVSHGRLRRGERDLLLCGYRFVLCFFPFLALSIVPDPGRDFNQQQATFNSQQLWEGGSSGPFLRQGN